MHIIWGLIFIAIGALITMKSEAMLNAFGRIEFFERHLGASGGTRLGYKLIGFFVIFIGMLVLTNMIGGFIMWALSPILKYSQPI
ncbi:hypothetical protein KKC83_00660 [Patescibacteria group bacterium]|nr:hypothetical protein [Candidatus Falkowbacteria bacterium]MBU3906558.1 hypothetical protein [Patescibacteria group bacterium]MCG2698191.1 hypothetical protein [Candidatus Parcubacteria bacterium]MBU4014722.1 hypothetical protein [Patescibacteria group bacterium]MBU4026048.1 hypothetical protein [Patescibacteria group bacterium]